MTDIMKLHDAAVAAALDTAARSLGDRDQKTRAALQSAIEALQTENGQLHARLQSSRVAFEQVCKHRDALQAKLYAAPKALEPLTDEQSATLFQAVKDDPRSAKFSVKNWFTCGLVTAEAAHGITKGTPT